MSDIPGRLRVKLSIGFLCEAEVCGIESLLCTIGGVSSASVHAANGSVLVRCDADPAVRAAVFAAIGNLDVLSLPVAETPRERPELALAEEDNRFRLEVADLLVWSALRRLLPVPIRTVITIVRALRHVQEGLHQLLRGRLCVEVLDATAIAASILRGTPGEADTIMLLLGLSDAMERHVRSRARLSLEQGLVARTSHVWRVVDGEDELVALERVRVGDLLRLRAGSVVPVDGCVERGVAELNEASMTGEAELVRKEAGSSVFAGTAVEGGELVVRVTASPGTSRIDAIAAMVERTAELKSASQSKAEALADRLVPVAFAGFLGILAVTRNVGKALAVLMVDYSCALRLSTPIAVMSAMREAAEYDVVVKGGKYLEAFAEADTIAFDKTGTLTQAAPHLSAVVSAGNASEDTILRLAACIEEHFPHSVAHAIVDGAVERGLTHEPELHAQVRYIVAHGIAAEVAASMRSWAVHISCLRTRVCRCPTDSRSVWTRRLQEPVTCISHVTGSCWGRFAWRIPCDKAFERRLTHCANWASSMSSCSRGTRSAPRGRLLPRRASTSTRPRCCPKTRPHLWRPLRHGDVAS